MYRRAFIGAIVAVAVTSPWARAQMVPVAQNRSITVGCSADIGHSNTSPAPDFGPFNLTQSTICGGAGFGGGSSTASQNSTILPNEIHMIGSTQGGFSVDADGGIFHYCSANADSHLSFTFDLSSAAPFVLSATM